MRFQENENVPWAKARGTRRRNKNYGKINRSIQSRKQLQKNESGNPFSTSESRVEEDMFRTSEKVSINRYGWEDVPEKSVTFQNKKTFKRRKYQQHSVYESGKEYVASEVSNQAKRSSTKKIADKTVSKVVNKTGGLPSKAVHVAKEIAQKVRKELTEALQQQKDEKEKNKNTGTALLISFPLLLVGGIIAFAGLFITTIPALILSFLISTNVEKQIVSVAEQEYYIWDQNIGGQKYKDWYGLDGNWCAMFVSYCSEQCGYINEGIMPRTASVAEMAGWYLEREQFHYARDGYEPKPGDIIFFQEGMSHVGIVIKYDSETKLIYTIEGNTGSSETEIYHEGSQVMLQIYPLTYARITGYASPDYPIDYSLDREIVMYYDEKNERRLCA